jgi:hypothetical protein
VQQFHGAASRDRDAMPDTNMMLFWDIAGQVFECWGDGAVLLLLVFFALQIGKVLNNSTLSLKYVMFSLAVLLLYPGVCVLVSYLRSLFDDFL